MIDIKLIREDAPAVEKALKKKDPSVSLDKILELDEKRRKRLAEVEDLKHKRNKLSDTIGKFITQMPTANEIPKSLNLGFMSNPNMVSANKEEVKKVSARIKDIDTELIDIEESLKSELGALPNIPHESVPFSLNADDKQIVNQWKEKPTFDFPIKNHVEIGKALGLFDFERAVKVSQSQFAMYTGQGALLEWALIRYMIEFLTQKRGFTLIIPPYLVNETTAYTSGNLPKFRDQLYKCADDELYLIPTSEVPLGSMHRDEILAEEDLPVYYCSYTCCFRREAGAHGKNERGLIRVHQFNKVEMFKYTKPETSFHELDTIIRCAEEMVEGLGLHYRTALLVTTDIAQQSAKTCDIEVWLPGQDSYYEVSSCSNCTDFQARRGNIRYRAADSKKPSFVHTLNGSGLATSRLMVSLLETYQQADGTVIIPEVLRQYMGGQERLTPPVKK